MSSPCPGNPIIVDYLQNRSARIFAKHLSRFVILDGKSTDQKMLSLFKHRLGRHHHEVDGPHTEHPAPEPGHTTHDCLK